MSENTNDKRQNKGLSGIIVIIEDNPDHAEYIKEELSQIYNSLNIFPEIVWFQFFNKALEYLESKIDQGEVVLSVWVDLYLYEYGNNKRPTEILQELYDLLEGITNQIYPISSLISQFPSMQNFTKKQDINLNNQSLTKSIKGNIENILDSQSLIDPISEQYSNEIEEIRDLIYGKQLSPGLADKVRLLDQKLDKLELDSNFQYMKLEKLVDEIKSATWLLWLLVRISKKFSLSDKLIGIITSVGFGGGITYFLIKILNLIE